MTANLTLQSLSLESVMILGIIRLSKSESPITSARVFMFCIKITLTSIGESFIIYCTGGTTNCKAFYFPINFEISLMTKANDPLTCWLVSPTVFTLRIGRIFSTKANEEQCLANSGNLATASERTSGSLSCKRLV